MNPMILSLPPKWLTLIPPPPGRKIYIKRNFTFFLFEFPLADILLGVFYQRKDHLYASVHHFNERMEAFTLIVL